MSGRTVALAVVALVSATTAPIEAQKATLKWGPAPPSLPAGARMAVISGNPGAPGPFTIRLELPNGFTISPHFHPVDEHQTLITGRIGHGMGDTVDVRKVKWLRPGQSVVLPANVHHYVKTRGRTVVAVSAMGPLSVTYVDPKDDPRKK